MNTLEEQAIAHGVVPPTQSNDFNIIGPRWFRHIIEIPNAATTEVDLKTGSILATDPMINARFGTPGNDFIAHIIGFHVGGFSAEWVDLPASEKAKVLKGMTVQCTQGGLPFAERLGPHIYELLGDQYTDVDSDNATLEIYGQANGAPLILDDPWTINLGGDQLKLTWNSTTQPAGPIEMLFEWFGFFAPNDVPRAKIIELQNGIKINAAGKGIPHGVRGAFGRQAAQANMLRVGKGYK